MTGQAKEWLIFGVFCVLLLVVIFGETAWLRRSAKASAGKALAFVLVTDLAAWIGSFVVNSMITLGMFMVVMGADGKGTTGNDALLWTALLLLFLLPLMLLFAIKRICLALFKIDPGMSAWTYSLGAGLVTLLIVLVPPSLLIYLL
jgi:hypothetical protein